jgi:Flp pilus assembly protein TadB
VATKGGNDPSTWDARWLARLSANANRRDPSAGLTNALSVTHGVIVAGVTAATGASFYLALSAVTLAILLVRWVAPPVKRAVAQRQAREAPDPFGR